MGNPLHTEMPSTWGTLLCFTVLLVATESTYLNVHGGPLETCSSPGMALTGYTRGGNCVAHNDDAGSHHVCIDLSSNTGGNFCTVTGQPDWCSSTMGCHGGGRCQIKHWCVCEWAFARYLEKAGGCDKIQNIVCEATNMVAKTHYRKQAVNDPSINAALECLEQRCTAGGQTDARRKRDKDGELWASCHVFYFPNLCCL